LTIPLHQSVERAAKERRPIPNLARSAKDAGPGPLPILLPFQKTTRLPKVKSLDRFGRLAKTIRGKRVQGANRVWDPRSFRLRYLVAVLLVAVLIAAVLRHVLHVYGGVPREEIRWEALAGALVILFATLLFRKYRS
jgi:hypothetical protein